MARVRHVAVIGLGRFGSSIAVHLEEMGVEVLAVDERMDLVEALRDRVSEAVRFDASDRDALRERGLEGVDAVVVAIGEHFEATVLVTALAKELKVPRILARSHDALQKRILELVGATQVLNPEEEMGQRVARSLARGDVADVLDLPDDHGVEDRIVEKGVAGSTLGEYLSPAEGRVVAVNLRRRRAPEEGEEGHEAWVELLGLPPTETVLEEGDALLLLGERRSLEKI
jgi:trk system potassium uptake protein TrkA